VRNLSAKLYGYSLPEEMTSSKDDATTHRLFVRVAFQTLNSGISICTLSGIS